MSYQISRTNQEILRREVGLAARHLQRKLQIPSQDIADLRQDLLTDLIARMPAFDPARGTLGAFASVVVANRAKRIAAKIRRERKIFGAAPISLDETIPGGDGATRGDLVAEDQGLSAYLGQAVNGFAQTERRLDFERGLGTLGADDRSFCAALSHTTIDRIAASGGGARASLYRRVKNIRLALTATGVEAA